MEDEPPGTELARHIVEGELVDEEAFARQQRQRAAEELARRVHTAVADTVLALRPLADLFAQALTRAVEALAGFGATPPPPPPGGLRHGAGRYAREQRHLRRLQRD